MHEPKRNKRGRENTKVAPVQREARQSGKEVTSKKQFTAYSGDETERPGDEGKGKPVIIDGPSEVPMKKMMDRPGSPAKDTRQTGYRSTGRSERQPVRHRLRSNEV